MNSFLFQYYSLSLPLSLPLSLSLYCSRITGLFRLSARMINRDVFTSPIIELFKLFLPSQNNRREKSEDINADIERTLNSTEDQDSITNEFQKKPVNTPSGLSLALLGDLSGQISSGIWRVLTTNLEVLPTLTLSQWQIIFDVIGE